MPDYTLRLERGPQNFILSNRTMSSNYQEWWFSPKQAEALRDALTEALDLITQPPSLTWDIPWDKSHQVK